MATNKARPSSGDGSKDLTAVSRAEGQERGGRGAADDLGLALPPEFFEEFFERRWAILPAADGARELFREIWGWRPVLRLAAREGFHAYERGIPRPAHDPQKGLGLSAAAASAKRAMQNNLTLVQNHAHAFHAPLARYMRRASIFFGLPGGMNSYTTPPGGLGFAYHFDGSDAFILQVMGSKHWEICARQYPDPFGFANLTYNQLPPGHPHVESCSQTWLHEGDALYLPAGQIHRAVASAGVSIHLTMSLNRQFCATSALLLNVAEQVNPSKEYGFAQKPFIHWVHGTASDPALAQLHKVPETLLCKSKSTPCTQKGFFSSRVWAGPEHAQDLSARILQRFTTDLKRAASLLRQHPSASSASLMMGVRVEGKTEPVVGKLSPGQVLDGLLPLLTQEACGRALQAWRKFLLQQLSQCDEVILYEEDLGDSDEDDLQEAELADVYGNPDILFPSRQSSMEEILRQMKASAMQGDGCSASTGLGQDQPWGEGGRQTQPESREDSSPLQTPRQALPAESAAASGVTGELLEGDVSESTQAHSHPVGGVLLASCCTAVSARAQVKCANSTAAPEPNSAGDEGRVLIVTYATPHVHSYARFSLAVNANWARRFNHSFVIDARDRATGGVDVKNSKVLVKKHWVSRPDLAEKWVLWIGADAILTDFDELEIDVLRRLIATEAADPQIQVLITRDPRGRAGNSLSLFNADVILLRRTAWTSRFLQRWWDDPRMREGRTDQEVLELLYTEDVFGALKAFRLLPPLTLNSDSLSIVAGSPRQQPVVHLGGHADGIRKALFQGALRLLCEEAGIEPNGLQLRDLYIKALEAEVANPGTGVSSGHVHSSAMTGTFQRLAWQLEQLGKAAEAEAVQRQALRVATERLGPQHRDTLQAATALGTTLRLAGRPEEAETLLSRAYRGLSSTLGPEDRDTLASANNLGLVFEALGRRGEAVGLFRMAREGLIRTLGENSVLSLSVSFNLAHALAQQAAMGATLTGWAEAEQIHRAVLLERERMAEADGTLVIESQEALAGLLLQRPGATQKLAEEAEALQTRALAAREATAEPDRGLVQAHSTLAQALRMQQRLEEATSHFQAAYDLCRSTAQLGGPDGPNTLAAASNLAAALQESGRLDEAGPLHRAAAVGLRRALGSEHPNSIAAKVNYEQFLKAVEEARTP